MSAIVARGVGDEVGVRVACNPTTGTNIQRVRRRQAHGEQERLGPNQLAPCKTADGSLRPAVQGFL